jgi:hypothetical protein
MPTAQKSRGRQTPSTSSTNGAGGSSVRFVVVSNPEQLRDRTQLRLNRQHVMKDYLTKEASKPDSKDIRVHGYQNRKRPAAEAYMTPASTASPPSLLPSDAASTNADQSALSHKDQRSELADVSRKEKPSEPVCNIESSRATKLKSGPATTNAPLVTGMSGKPEQPFNCTISTIN